MLLDVMLVSKMKLSAARLELIVHHQPLIVPEFFEAHLHISVYQQFLHQIPQCLHVALVQRASTAQAEG
jgi:hypothetical protein